MWTGHHKWDLHDLIVIFPLLQGSDCQKSKATKKHWVKKINQAPAFHVEKQTPKVAVAALTHRLILNF